MSLKEKSLKLNLIKSTNCFGYDFYTGAIRLRDLFESYAIPVYNPKQGSIDAQNSGYQREAKLNRIKQVQYRITDPITGMDIPNTEPFVDNINLNLRAADLVSYVKPLDKNFVQEGDVFVYEHVASNGKFQIVDGQTRIRGAHDAYNSAKANNKGRLAEEIGELRVPFTLTFCDDVYKEAYIFYLINQYSKSIPPDGATRLLFEGQKNGQINFINEVTRTKKEEIIDSMYIAEKLNQESEVWAGKMRDFNENATGKTSIRAVAKTIKPFLESIKRSKDKFKSEQNPIDLTYEIIEAYWAGFKKAFAPMFNLSGKYNVYKAGPSEIMMKVLHQIFDANISNPGHIKGSLKDKQTYADLLQKGLRNVEDYNVSGKKVSGADMFLVGKLGAMGKYSNEAAKKDQAQRISRAILKEQGFYMV